MDRLIRVTTALAVVTVAVVAAIISYQHAYELVRPRRGVAQKRRERVEGPGIRRGRSGPGPLRAPGARHLLAQQLLAAGEQVLDVQPKLGARVRLLTAGDTNKNDPNDARSVAVAALRSPGVAEVRPDDHAAPIRSSHDGAEIKVL